LAAQRGGGAGVVAAGEALPGRRQVGVGRVQGAEEEGEGERSREGPRDRHARHPSSRASRAAPGRAPGRRCMLRAMSVERAGEAEYRGGMSREFDDFLKVAIREYYDRGWATRKGNFIALLIGSGQTALGLAKDSVVD